MSLKKYRKKRSFGKTPEPKGIIQQRISNPLHFVVQKHDASHLHYDFRLELDGVLKSWAIPKGPSLNPADKRLAMMTEDHPLDYQNFEGKIPKGHYGAGDVIVWDKGVYLSDKAKNNEESRKQIKEQLKKGKITFVLLGEKLKGKFTLLHLKNKKENAWLLIKAKDEYASQDDVTKEMKSVLSGKFLPKDNNKKEEEKQQDRKKEKLNTMKKEDPMPQHFIKPMLSRLVQAPFDKKGWIFEPKWDGYRAITVIKNNKIHMYSRNKISFNDTYPIIIKALSKIKKNCILDGEIIALKNGNPDFHTLQDYQKMDVPIRYVIFDLLYYDRTDLRSWPLKERKKVLKKMLPSAEHLLLSEYTEERGKLFFQKIVSEKGEGMIAKDAYSPYKEGIRSDAWLKIKTMQEQEAIIVGYTKPRRGRKFFGALVLAAYDEGELTYIGHSGGGFMEKELEELYQKFLPIQQKESPLKEKVPIHSPITWVQPKYVCQIKFLEWTKDGRMRQPVYAGLRIDKEPAEVRKEIPQEKVFSSKTIRSEKKFSVAITHPEKIYWPQEGITKREVVSYYDQFSDIILPYLKDRPMSLHRHPHGIEGESFFQKNITMRVPDYVVTKKIWSESNNKYIRYLVCNNKKTLLYLANLGCIELNPWNSRITHLHDPDYMILDVDPHERPFSDLIMVAREIHKLLDISCEEHFIKTSGKTGLHIVIPLRAKYNYDIIREFSNMLMQIVHAQLPTITSIQRNPKDRKGKIYLDYLQNRWGQTLACAYSLRPYPGATVSTPLQWDEVTNKLDPSQFTIKTLQKRLEKKGDLWKGTLGKGVNLIEAIHCLEKSEV